ncbi:MAG: alpha/beta hydrolase [Pseudomonadota bacterium]
MKPTRLLSRLILLSLLLLASLAILGYTLGTKAIAPANREVGAPPPDLQAESVLIPDADGLDVSTWIVEPRSDKAIILLAHGLRGNKRAMISRARLLKQHGYGAVLIDLRSHGESSGSNMTFGLEEAQSIIAVLGHIRIRWPDRKISLIGQSLGGAAAIVAAKTHRVDAYVLEAVYSSLRAATQNRFELRFGPFGRFITPALLWQVPLRLGFSVDALDLTQRISDLCAPVLIISGDQDVRTTAADTEELFAAAQNPKSLWMIEGARHQDLYRFSGEAYEKRVLGFFADALQGRIGTGICGGR